MTTTNPNLQQIRESMKEKGLTAYLIPRTDPHQSEYIAPHWEIISWLSGFTGSAGTIVITEDFAGVWTDSRYFIQAASQLEGSGFNLVKLRVPHTPEYMDWMYEQLPIGSKVGCDGRLLSMTQLEKLKSQLQDRDIAVEADHDLVSELWEDRPPLPASSVFEHSIQFAGASRAEKLSSIRAEMARIGATVHLMTSLDDIAWTFNIRGNDVAYNPVAIAYALVEQEKATLFISPEKVSAGLAGILAGDHIGLAPYEAISDRLAQLNEGEVLAYSPNKTSEWLGAAIPPGIKCRKVPHFSTRLKAIKNEVEQAHIREVMAKDGVALVHFLKWLEDTVGQEQVTEISAAEKLREFRAQQPDFVGESFGTIAGYRGHGAIVHYSADEETNATLQAEGLFLCDSGGQYLDGTTDITRTIALGEPGEEEREDYTLVLKGHIALARAVFPKGTAGHQLDVLARQFLWQHQQNYGHGTGHGVGFFLNVHEGPQGIGTGARGGPGGQLVPGMLTSNEPGMYREGKHGIRIENLVLTIPHSENDFGTFYAFETVTLCPIDTSLIKTSWLTAEERAWVNAYHTRVKETLSPILEPEYRSWLEDKCQPV